MEAFIYKADLYCGDCGREIKRELSEACPDCHGVNEDFEDCAGECPTCHGGQSETEFDSDNYPKGPYADGGGESDTPEHCHKCGTFLENPLTEDGYAYLFDEILEWLTGSGGDAKVIREWWEYYRNDGYDTEMVIDKLFDTIDAKLAGPKAPAQVDLGRVHDYAVGVLRARRAGAEQAAAVAELARLLPELSAAELAAIDKYVSDVEAAARR